MPACHASCLAMLAMRPRSRSRCSAVLLCYRTQLLSLKQVPSRRPIHLHHMSLEVSRSSASRPASEQMMIRNEGVRIAPWLRSMLLASVLNLGMPDARMRPRGDRFYRPPAAAPLSLQPNGHFECPAVAEARRSWLPLAWPRRAQCSPALRVVSM